jgi:hypothetical protein
MKNRWENIINTLGLGLGVDVLAQAMVADAERVLAAEKRPGANSGHERCDDGTCGDGALALFEGNAAIAAEAPK